MLQQIADLVEFDLNRFSKSQVVEDFNHKFSRAIVKIDSKYYQVTQLDNSRDKLILYLQDKNNNEVILDNLISIEKVHPKTGLYQSDKGLVYLSRIPKRQWIKSLSLENNYTIHVLAKGIRNETPTLYDTILVDHPQYHKETAIYKNKVYLHWLKVGVVEGDNLFVTNKNFFEEIKELWNKQYQIILDVNYRQQKVEKLILDF